MHFGNDNRKNLCKTTARSKCFSVYRENNHLFIVIICMQQKSGHECKKKTKTPNTRISLYNQLRMVFQIDRIINGHNITMILVISILSTTTKTPYPKSRFVSIHFSSIHILRTTMRFSQRANTIFIGRTCVAYEWCAECSHQAEPFINHNRSHLFDVFLSFHRIIW